MGRAITDLRWQELVEIRGRDAGDLCHNICCLIHSQFELDIFPEFWSKSDGIVPKVNSQATCHADEPGQMAT
jgi:hypothetical protein